MRPDCANKERETGGRGGGGREKREILTETERQRDAENRMHEKRLTQESYLVTKAGKTTQRGHPI